jgi:hypothetical protein
MNEIEAHLKRVREANLRKLVANARAILTYQVGIPFGCKRMRVILFALKSSGLSYPVFDDYREATRDVPTGSERLHWNRKVLEQKDIELEAIDKHFRKLIFDACYDIIEAFSKNGTGEQKS